MTNGSSADLHKIKPDYAHTWDPTDKLEIDPTLFYCV